MDLNSKNKILFVFEGEKTEPAIYDKIKEYFFSENTIITCVFGTVIYALYKDLKNDDDLEVFMLLKERIEDLKNYKNDDFSEIYLFFDYDIHSSNSSLVKLEELLKIFNNETKNGKLYISYPMVEALKHYKDLESFQNLNAICSPTYKKEVNGYCRENNIGFLDFNTFTKNQWIELINAHLHKCNFIINDEYKFPSQEEINQLEIFENQKIKFIDEFGQVSVLSAFPVFIYDYYGCVKTKDIMQNA